ncbi:cell division protein FtsW [Leucobacter viscericola]|uniref:Probable peptidoglycan glycosyltransferase FtsW n=1 Tax=Leucobacter viscericola TaxID=2714935 RepID=A0A6G7XC97_9MICO|nr:putative peptidoglycan glycosyltransferase FtsW [Leucobacter viscericola]QIK62183.1 cell division protein FtsW [Leucobacter viscericola]
MSTPTKAKFVLPAERSARFRVIPAAPAPLRRLTILLLAMITLLVGLGVIMVQSAGQVVAISNGGSPFSGLLRQGGFALIGICCMVLLSQVSTARLRRYSWVALLFGIALQLLVYTPLGYEAGGNRNWLRVGPVSMQPAEFMKVVLLVWVSAVIANKQPLLSRWQHVAIPILPVVALSMFINVLGGDLGTLMVIAALVFGCLYFSQVRWRILGGIALLAALGVAVMTAMKPNRVFRVIQFLEIDCLTDAAHAHGMCWQSLNGFWALSNGGLLGAGVGNSKAKWSWLPESETDFIFAIIGEEMGFLGAVAVILLIVGIVVVLLALLARCTTPFATSILGGLLVWIGAQACVNIAVVLGFIPVLGVPLPFVSAGGTSLVSGLMAVGVVLACVREEAAGPPPPAPTR